MLREVELALVELEHITMDFENKTIKLVLPVTKTDQESNKVTRVLQCCCDVFPCKQDCPCYVTARLLDGMQAKKLKHACTTKRGKRASKAALVGDWRTLFGSASGHSARRTGALMYIRAGWAIAQVAFLGSWKSNIIYQYANEALEPLPVNNRHTYSTAEASGKGGGLPDPKMLAQLEDTKNKLLVELAATKVNQQKALEALDGEVESLRNRCEENNHHLPRFVQSLTSKVNHHNMSLALCSPPFTWRTRCGWHYYKSDFAFCTKADENVCQKCQALAQSS